MTDEEKAFLEALQTGLHVMKSEGDQLAHTARKFVSHCHKKGYHEKTADAMEMHGGIEKAMGALREAHAKASRAIIAHYGDAGRKLIDAGPIR